MFLPKNKDSCDLLEQEPGIWQEAHQKAVPALIPPPDTGAQEQLARLIPARPPTPLWI